MSATAICAYALQMDRTAWRAQLAVPAPSFAMLGLAIIAPMLIEQFAKFVCAALALPMNQMAWWFRLIWFVSLVGVCGTIVCCLLRRYPLPARMVAAKVQTRKQLLPWIVVIAPLAIYYLMPMIRFASRFARLVSLAVSVEERAELAAHLQNWHAQVWAGIGFGSDGAGVVLGSLLVLAMPLCEEILFRGYLMNILGRRLGNAFVAVVVTAVVFASLHIFRTTSLHDLSLLFIAGMGYGLIRLCSGSWVDAWLAHAAVNVAVMAPKWFLAVCSYWFVPKLLEAH